MDTEPNKPALVVGDCRFCDEAIAKGDRVVEWTAGVLVHDACAVAACVGAAFDRYIDRKREHHESATVDEIERRAAWRVIVDFQRRFP